MAYSRLVCLYSTAPEPQSLLRCRVSVFLREQADNLQCERLHTYDWSMSRRKGRVVTVSTAPDLHRIPGSAVQSLFGQSCSPAAAEEECARKYFRTSPECLAQIRQRTEEDILLPLREYAASSSIASKQDLERLVSVWESIWDGVQWPMGRSFTRHYEDLLGSVCVLICGLCPKKQDRGSGSTSAYSKCCNAKYAEPLAAAVSRISSSSGSARITLVFEEARGYCDAFTDGMHVATDDDDDEESGVLDTLEKRCRHAGCWNAAARTKQGIAYSSAAWTAVEQQRLAATVALSQAMGMSVKHIVCLGTRASQLVTGSGLLTAHTQEAACCVQFSSLVHAEPSATRALHWSYWMHAARKYKPLLRQLAATYHAHNAAVLERLCTVLQVADTAAVLADARSRWGCYLDSTEVHAATPALSTHALVQLIREGDLQYHDTDGELRQAEREVAAAVQQLQADVKAAANVLVCGAVLHSSHTAASVDTEMQPCSVTAAARSMAARNEELYRGAQQLHALLDSTAAKAAKVLRAAVTQCGAGATVIAALDTGAAAYSASATVSLRLWTVTGVDCTKSGQLAVSSVCAPAQNRRLRKLGAGASKAGAAAATVSVVVLGCECGTAA